MPATNCRLLRQLRTDGDRLILCCAYSVLSHASAELGRSRPVAAEADETVSAYIDLSVDPVLLIDRAVPLDAAVHPQRFPTQLVVGETFGRKIDGRLPAPVPTRLRLRDGDETARALEGETRGRLTLRRSAAGRIGRRARATRCRR